MSKMNKLDKKGIFWFLLITFTITISIAIILWLLGFSFIGKGALVAQFSIAGAMFIPGISAFMRIPAYPDTDSGFIRTVVPATSGHLADVKILQ